MPRPRICRNIESNPSITYFKPRGIRLRDIDEVSLNIDEFEAVKLKDFKGLEQNECANSMKISQPTFHRLILSARKKIADAIINGKAIKINNNQKSY